MFTWNDIKERFKSPVVVIQVITIVGGAVALAWPGLADGWKILAGVIASVWNVLAGLNNPTDKVNF